MPPCPSGAVAFATIAESSVAVGQNFRVVRPSPLPAPVPPGPALHGSYGLRRLRDSMVLHASDAVDLHDLVTQVERAPGMSVQVFLNGTVNASMGGRHLLADAQHGEVVPLPRPQVVVSSRTQTELFERRAQQGDRIRKVSLSLSPHWLESYGDLWKTEAQDLYRFSRQHMARRSWTPSAQVVALAERLVQTTHSNGALAALYQESAALELLGQVFTTFTDPPAPRPEPRDQQRLRRIEEFLASTDSALVSLDDLAGAAGTSISTVQRLFQTTYGLSAFEALRRRALERARAALQQGLSVKEAAYLAGYGSAANFSTAFRKHFGCSPGRYGDPSAS
ncbi:AraC family transcriptional regulator [Insolitispirillum peregrinum]|uniref:Transcriptional regulator, AraC family n=1 Tax=Insolitispirillum peregrinum TaxID=80876 RepID=A0A1N7JIS5_9PROT|nr:AraC family transcriptional regulator [Insolitispirillum peregrinum]SIS49164.1 transcriptional regulator, AraC family [Insolitispirillum peregrinum]